MTTRRLIREADLAAQILLASMYMDVSQSVKDLALLHFALAHQALKAPPLASPRLRYTQGDLDVLQSFWERTRERQKETAFFKFLGMPRFLFEQLAELIRPLLPQYDKTIKRPGQPTKLDHIDVLAVCLRYTQLKNNDYLEDLSVYFARNGTVLARALKDGMEG